MAKPEFNQEFAANALLEALVTTDEKACKRYGITDRTLRNYKRRLESDPVFSAFFRNRKKIFDDRWADRLVPMLLSGIETIHEITRKVREDPSVWRNPQMLDSLTRALEVASDVSFTSRIIDARINENRTPDALPGQEPSEADGEPGQLVH